MLDQLIVRYRSNAFVTVNRTQSTSFVQPFVPFTQFLEFVVVKSSDQWQRYMSTTSKLTGEASTRSCNRNFSLPFEDLLDEKTKISVQRRCFVDLLDETKMVEARRETKMEGLGFPIFPSHFALFFLIFHFDSRLPQLRCVPSFSTSAIISNPCFYSGPLSTPFYVLQELLFQNCAS